VKQNQKLSKTCIERRNGFIWLADNVYNFSKLVRRLPDDRNMLAYDGMLFLWVKRSQSKIGIGGAKIVGIEYV
jgi:hypothetical protein